MPQETNHQQNRQAASSTAAGSSLDRYTVQPRQEDGGQSPYYRSAAPQISLPKGGGALKGIDEKFEVNAVNGTAGLSIPLPLSPGRGGFTPALSLSYSSGAGNSAFGLGWDLGLPAIQRRTDKKLPRYNDAEESDVFVLSGAEDLVPVIDGAPNPFTLTDTVDGHTVTYTIKRYRPRIEGLFARIEYIKKAGTADSWWRVTTKDNITTYYGLTAEGRITDPGYAYRIFKWLPQLALDHKGNVQWYQYIAEDLRGVAAAVFEKNRLNGLALFANTYLKRVQYGNKEPFFISGTGAAAVYEPVLPASLTYLMECVLDYGDHSTPYSPVPDRDWQSRSDACSGFQAGFEIRTYRRCQRLLQFHHFSEMAGNDLVRSLELAYQNGAYDAGSPPTAADLIVAATQRGYQHTATGWRDKALPAMQFSYQPLTWSNEIQVVGKDDFRGAPQGLTGPYQWIDFEGEGISGILTEQAGGWFYKNNLGDGHFDTPKTIAPKPSFTGLTPSASPSGAAGVLQWQDLDADGRRQVVAQSPLKGYWELDDPASPSGRAGEGLNWRPFRAFDKNINIDWNSPFTKMLDLDGDGKADVLLTEDRAWTWYENKGKEGFDVGGSSPSSGGGRGEGDEEKGPVLLLRDEVQSIFLADMNGDGLTDLVRIRNGEVCFWPNKGYGSFGARVTMLNAPLFQRPELYNPLYLTLADISGTGAADLIYVGRNKCTAWLNCCGNAFAYGVDINPLPGTDVYSKIAVTDFLGNGTACIVWSSLLPHDATAPLQYIDLMAGHKPYLMTGYSNGTGKSVAMSYKSSTQFYLADKLAGISWATRLPFPVHCVSAVTTTDSVSHTVYTQTYKYRHGYYDHEEREYRGFGYVEILDTDSASLGAPPPPEGDGGRLDQPPVLTKTWYHTGAWMREGTLLDRFKEEYFQFEGWDDLVSIASFPAGLNAQELREAHRALKGSLLRQEVYAQDDGPDKDVPYTIAATAYAVKEIQPLGGNRYASFLNLQQQSVAFSCERHPDDPHILHSLALQTDEYGNVLQSAQVAYPRKNVPSGLPQKVQEEQGKRHITCTENTFTNDAIDEAHYTFYRLRLPWEAKSYEADFDAPEAALYTVAELKSYLDNAIAVDYTVMPALNEIRLLGHTKTLFLADDAATIKDEGQIESLALPYEHYTLAFTPGTLAAIYGTLVTPAMLAEGGYKSPDADGAYWLPSGRAVYSSPQAKFYTPETFRDPWGNETTVSYWGAYWLLPETVTDAKGNVSSVTAYDWRILQPLGLKDANNNISEILYDAPGMPVAMALKGKDDGTEGDTLAGLDPDSAADLASQAAFWDDPEAHAAALLQGATWRCVYDLPPAPSEGKGVAVGMIAREEHNTDNPDSPMLLRLSYSDGMGRVLMHKVPCEATPDNGNKGWIGSGRTIYNNKGSAVMQYEPYFSGTPTCDTAEQAAAEGVSPQMHYDPLGRLYRTDLPDGSYTKTEWTAWEQTVWDNNDTVLDSAWYAARIGGAMGPEEQDAAEKAAAHAGTPAVMHSDSLARPFYTIQQDTQSTYINSYEILDIQSNRLSVVDGRGQQILQYRYAPLQTPGYRNSKDSGLWRSFTDVAGQALYSWDPGGRQFHTIYDVLRRPVQQEVLQNAVTRVLEQFIYGEGQPDDKQNNLRGALFQHKDGAGSVQADHYDFKGNLLISVRTYTQDATQHPNWGGTVAMETDTYTTAGTFDALNRPVTVTTPEGGITEYTYDKGGMLKTVTVDNVHSLDTGIVNNIEYDAKGQRQQVQYGNGTATNYTYDPDTFRVTRIRTLRGTTVLQDLQYWYDPIGNITLQKDGAQQPVYFDGSVATPENDYTYDALYRLTGVSGRELAGNNNAPTYNDSSRLGITPIPIAATDTAKMRRYAEAYTYDKAGNMLTQQHTVTGGTGNWTRTYTIAGGNNRLTGCSIGSNNPVAETYTHDGRGNIATGFNHLQSLAYNDANRLQRVIIDGNRTVYYQYDGTGQRVRKTVVNSSAHTTESRKYIGNFELYRNFDTSSLNINLERETLNVHDDTGRIALIDTRTVGTGMEPAQLLRYQYSNHLGTAALELDAAGAVISYEEYYPYGGTSFQSGRTAAEVSLKRYRYTGKERDKETGLYYHGARYYIPWLCRWAASDPLEDQYAALSSYHYGFDNPIKWTDSTGMGPDDPKKPLPPPGSEGNPIHLKEVQITAEAIKPVSNLPVLKAVNAADNTRVFRLNNPPAQQYFFSDKEYFAYKATKAEPTILAADMYGTGHIGPATQVKSIIASIKQEHVNAVFENIRGGFFGSLGYMIGGEQGSFSGARLDQAMVAAVAMRTTEPVNPVQERFVAQTETPKSTVGTGTQLKLSMEQAAEVNPALAAKGVGEGFRSFSAFKRVMGPAGEGQAWHHIVEQTPGNVSRFGAEAIHNTDNLMKLPHGAGSIHARVSGYYSSIQPFTNGQTVRQWLSTQSYQAQYDFGIQTLKKFGWTP